MEIIPAIIAKDLGELKNKISQVENLVMAVQLDVMDGVFVPNATWNNPKDLFGFKTNLFLEAHLMVKEPARILDNWLTSPAGRIIVHCETGADMKEIASRVHQAGKEFGVALNPETEVEVLDNFISEIDLVLFLSVQPGFGGQKFLPKVLPKISRLRQKNLNVKIAVDGGINLSNAKQVKEAGADILVVGSAIFASGDAKEAIARLQAAIK
ncbi:MAG: ribulose-phosphate 3-epimerase [Candidatus Portnoybacteria bacterium]|nr:ribulose-phosphate 3-epimerase [Candidatus Portnoybacteria bacterium]